MSNRSGRNILLHFLRQLAFGLMRIAAFIIAWGFKIIGQILDKIGNEILKFSER